MPSQTPAEIPFQQVLDALLDEDHPVNPRYLYRLSDLEQAEIKALRAVWSKVSLQRRQAIMEDIEQLSEDDTLLSFISLGRLAAKDEDPKVRRSAVSTLWVYEDNDLIPLLMELLEKDGDSEVRATAAGALGTYIYLGELEELPAKTLRTIEDALLKTIQGDDAPLVQRAALEAIGFSSREEVPGLIEKAYSSKEKTWVSSALFAMGRSANKIWSPQVMAMLESNLPLLRSEAARAAGELELTDAVPLLLDLLTDPDDNTRLAAIWSLSQIGGEGVREALEQLTEETEDEHDLEIIEDALDNLEFTEGAQLLPFFDFPQDNDGDEEIDDSIDSVDSLDYDEDLDT